MKKYIVIITIVFLGTTFIIKAQRKVLFFQEYIDFSIDGNYFSINGIFSFKNNNNQDINQQIIFPFGNESTEIDSIRIVNLHSGRQIYFDRKGNFIRFPVYFPANDTVDVNIFYRQKTSVKNKYIITSTQFWRNPLEKAVYTLTVEQNINIKSFSYLPDSIKEIDDKKLYIWEKHSFMPKEDFEITLDD